MLSAPVRKCPGNSKNRKHPPGHLAPAWQNLAQTHKAKASPPTLVSSCARVPSSHFFLSFFVQENTQNDFIRTVRWPPENNISTSLFGPEKVKITFSNLMLCWTRIGNTEGKQSVSRYWLRRYTPRYTSCLSGRNTPGQEILKTNEKQRTRFAWCRFSQRSSVFP